MFEGAEVISAYPWQQAVDDGMLATILEHRWPQLTGGRPLLATSAVVEAFSVAAIMEMWNSYVVHVKRGGDAGLFKTEMNGETVWVMADGETFTVMFPSDY